MTKNLAFLTFLVLSFSCSEDSPKEAPQVPWEAEWIPVNYTLGSDKTEHPINDCTDNISDFSEELNAFISGNLLIGRIADCTSCPGFTGDYTCHRDVMLTIIMPVRGVHWTGAPR